MSKTVKYLIALAILAAILVIFYTRVYTPKVSFTQTAPTQGALAIKVFGVGQVSAKNIYPITSSTGGKITTILTDEGQWVKKGDLLITIDAIDLPLNLAEAKIAVEKAYAEKNATEKELLSLNAQQDLAQLTLARNKQLKAQKLISQFDYDKAKTDLRVINAQIAATQARIRSAKVETIRAEKAVEALAVKLSRFKIYAPVDGYVIAKSAEVAQSVTPSQAILTIVDPKTVWIKAYIDERISGDIKVGQKATISLRSKPQQVFSGSVSRIVAQTDAVTQEKEVNVAFDHLPIPFYINEQATVTITTQQLSNVIKIPSQYLRYQDNTPGVWVNHQGKAHFKSVTIIARGDHEVAVKGLTTATTIILPDAAKKALRENMSIRS